MKPDKIVERLIASASNIEVIDAHEHLPREEVPVRTLDEWLDMVPVNKIIGFGADYSRCVEKVYGHLVMCRENLARVLARRMKRGLIAFEEAEWLLKRFLVDNPAFVYRLHLKD